MNFLQNARVNTKNATTVGKVKVGTVRSARLDQRRSQLPLPLPQPTKKQTFKSPSIPDLSKQFSQQSCQ